MGKPKITTAKAEGELDPFEAADFVGMSPELLKWFGSYATKQGIDRKLKIRKASKTFYIERDELLKFNDWLKLPWPSKGGARPPIPSGITREIKQEAGGDCAICRNNGSSCEAAHIDPVAKSKNNHPENLIWLCSTHHTKFDKDILGPKGVSTGFVRSFKQTYAFYRRSMWRQQAKASGELHSLLVTCVELRKQLKTATNDVELAAVEGVATKVLTALHQLKPSSEQGPQLEAYIAIKPELEKLAKKSTEPDQLAATLAFAEELKDDFVRRAGYVECPLCDGSGNHGEEDCPVCGGAAELTEGQLRVAELDRYDRVDCPLCKGVGIFRGGDCPPCQGHGNLERRYADQVDPTDWTEDDCTICKATGYLHGNECPVCRGDKQVDRRVLADLDPSQFELINCPRCEGSGEGRYGPCKTCGGDGQVERRHAGEIDPDEFDLVSCPICQGIGDLDERSCRACGGEGEIDREALRNINEDDYKLVDCPTCLGEDEFCRTCGGAREIRKWMADRL